MAPDAPTPDPSPHSRACGWRAHPHGPECSTNCPTCHGGPMPDPSPDTPSVPKRAVVQFSTGAGSAEVAYRAVERHGARNVERTGVTNVLDGLLGRIDDPELRAALEIEVANLRDTKDFGLVFERHLPENVELLSHEVRRGAKVRLRGTSDDLRVVRRVRDGVAELFDRIARNSRSA